MSIGSLTIILSVLQNKKYDRVDIQNCIIETSKKTKENPNDILHKLIDECIENTQFPVTLEYDDMTHSFKTVENAVGKMKAVILKDGIENKRTFIFTFKTFFPKGKLLTYKHLGYSFNKNRLASIIVNFRPRDYKNEYEIRYSCWSYQSVDLSDLVGDLKGVVHVIKQNHYTEVDQDYDPNEEGYNYGLDDLAGITYNDNESEDS